MYLVLLTTPEKKQISVQNLQKVKTAPLKSCGTTEAGHGKEFFFQELVSSQPCLAFFFVLLFLHIFRSFHWHAQSQHEKSYSGPQGWENAGFAQA